MSCQKKLKNIIFLIGEKIGESGKFFDWRLNYPTLIIFFRIRTMLGQVNNGVLLYSHFSNRWPPTNGVSPSNCIPLSHYSQQRFYISFLFVFVFVQENWSVISPVFNFRRRLINTQFFSRKLFSKQCFSLNLPLKRKRGRTGREVEWFVLPIYETTFWGEEPY